MRIHAAEAEVIEPPVHACRSPVEVGGDDAGNSSKGKWWSTLSIDTSREGKRTAVAVGTVMKLETRGFYPPRWRRKLLLLSRNIISYAVHGEKKSSKTFDLKDMRLSASNEEIHGHLGLLGRRAVNEGLHNRTVFQLVHRETGYAMTLAAEDAEKCEAWTAGLCHDPV